MLTPAGPQALDWDFDSSPRFFAMTWFLWFGVGACIFLYLLLKNELCAYGIRQRFGHLCAAMSFHGVVHVLYTKCCGILQATKMQK